MLVSGILQLIGKDYTKLGLKVWTRSEKKLNFEEVSFLDTGTNSSSRVPVVYVIDVSLLCKQY